MTLLDKKDRPLQLAIARLPRELREAHAFTVMSAPGTSPWTGFRHGRGVGRVSSTDLEIVVRVRVLHDVSSGREMCLRCRSVFRIRVLLQVLLLRPVALVRCSSWFLICGSFFIFCHFSFLSFLSCFVHFSFCSFFHFSFLFFISFIFYHFIIFSFFFISFIFSVFFFFSFYFILFFIFSSFFVFFCFFHCCHFFSFSFFLHLSIFSVLPIFSLHFCHLVHFSFFFSFSHFSIFCIFSFVFPCFSLLSTFTAAVRLRVAALASGFTLPTSSSAIWLVSKV